MGSDTERLEPVDEGPPDTTEEGLVPVSYKKLDAQPGDVYLVTVPDGTEPSSVAVLMEKLVPDGVVALVVPFGVTINKDDVCRELRQQAMQAAVRTSDEVVTALGLTYSDEEARKEAVAIVAKTVMAGCLK